MDKRELYDNFENMEEMSRDVQAMLASVKEEMTLHELEQKKTQETSNEEAGLSKSRKNLEKLYEEGFHVCNVDNMYGSRRINDEPCVFCQDVIYGERH